MSSTIRRFPLIATALAALLFSAALPVRAQDNQGPIAPPPKFEVKRIPAVPHPGPPPIPEKEIIQKFAANEDMMKEAYGTYDFTQTIRIEELSNPGGKFTVTGEAYVKSDGERYWRAAKPAESNLKVTDFTLEDVRTIISIPLFFLTTEGIGNYTFLYAGQQKLDELSTYVFQVKPKQFSRTRRFFEGAIWVDDRDLAIVKTYGKFVSELSGNGTNLPFTIFEVYREHFQDKSWLPTYISSDADMSGQNDTEYRLRLVIRSTNFRPISSPAAVPPPANTAPSAPQRPAHDPASPPQPASPRSPSSKPS